LYWLSISQMFKPVLLHVATLQPLLYGTYLMNRVPLGLPVVEGVLPE
jgi:hypothetical protein